MSEKPTIQADENPAASLKDLLEAMGRPVSLRSSNYIILGTPGLTIGRAAEEAFEKAFWGVSIKAPKHFTGIAAGQEAAQDPKRSDDDWQVGDRVQRTSHNQVNLIPAGTLGTVVSVTPDGSSPVVKFDGIEGEQQYPFLPNVHLDLVARVLKPQPFRPGGAAKADASLRDIQTRFDALVDRQKDQLQDLKADHEALLQQFRETKALLEKTTEERDRAIATADHLSDQVLHFSKAHDQASDKLKAIRLVLTKDGALRSHSSRK